MIQSLKPTALVVWEAPAASRENPFGLWQTWQKLGLQALHLEFHAGKAEWGQASYVRILAQKP